MNILINLIGIAILGLFAVFIFRGKLQAKKINDYFSKAVRVYALTNEEDVRTAIVTVAMIASKKQRASMVNYLQKIGSDLKKMADNDSELKPFIDKFISSSNKLAEEISSSEWTISDIHTQKKELGNINPEYLLALEKADSTIFIKKHPQLFK